MWKRALKWSLRIFLVLLVLFVVFLLSLDSIIRVLVEHNIRKQTGMEAEIGQFHLGLLEPVVSIKDLKLHNPPAFGGKPFLDIPEIYVKYDRDALAQGEIHITLLRFNLGELDIVKNAAGQTNLLSLGVTLPTKEQLGKKTDLADFKKQTGYEFTGIDALYVSVGTAKYIDLADAKNNREQNIDIENQVMKNVKTPADLAGLALLVALRSDDFFTRLATPMTLK